MYRPIFRIVTVLYFWNQSQCDFFHMLLDVSKPHPPTSQLIGFSIGVRNDPRKIFIIKTMDFNSIYLGLVQKRQEYQNLYISYKKGLSVQHAAPPRRAPLGHHRLALVGASSYLCTIGVH